MFVVTDADAKVRVPVYERFEWKWDAEQFISDSSFPHLTLFEEQHWVSSDMETFEYGPYANSTDAELVRERKERENPMRAYSTLVELIRP